MKCGAMRNNGVVVVHVEYGVVMQDVKCGCGIPVMWNGLTPY